MSGLVASGVALELVAEIDLQALVKDGIREGRRLEFKRCLPGDKDEDKREFLADASSLANAGGGDLVFGVDEYQGLAVKISPLAGDADAAILRLESILRTGVEPRLLGVRMQPVTVDDGWVLVVRVPKSWTAPHAVTLSSEGTYRFFSRNSAGKYRLDVGELRSSFMTSEAAGRRAREWQADRLGRIVARETPVPLRDTPLLVLHVIPLTPEQDIEPGALDGSGIFAPLELQANVTRWNIDGLVTYTLDDERIGLGYTQLFRDGRLEAINAVVIDWLTQGSDRRTVNGVGLERVLINGIANHLRALQIAGAQPPFALLVAIVGALGLEIVPPSQLPPPAPRLVDRDLLLLPDVLCETFDWDRARGMRPICDALWQASGWPKSDSFNANGDWRPDG